MNAIELTSEIVARIQVLLDARGWNKSDLARATGIAQPHVTRLMQASKATSLETITKIATAFGVHPRELLAEAKKPKK